MAASGTWEAVIVSKEMRGTTAVVTVEFSDGETTQLEEFLTNDPQDAAWPTEGIMRQLRRYNEVPAVLDNVSVGQVFSAAEPEAVIR